MGILGSDVKEIKIKWDPNPGRPLFPGEVVNGKIILITEKDDVKIQKATINFSGEISIHWVEVSDIDIFYIIITSFHKTVDHKQNIHKCFIISRKRQFEKRKEMSMSGTQLRLIIKMNINYFQRPFKLSQMRTGQQF